MSYDTPVAGSDIPDGQLRSSGRAKYAGFDLARADWRATAMTPGRQTFSFTLAYDVLPDPVASVSSPTVTVSGLTAGTSYAFTVRARNAAGNASAANAPITATRTVDPPSPDEPDTGNRSATSAPVSVRTRAVPPPPRRRDLLHHVRLGYGLRRRVHRLRSDEQAGQGGGASRSSCRRRAPLRALGAPSSPAPGRASSSRRRAGRRRSPRGKITFGFQVADSAKSFCTGCCSRNARPQSA